VRPTSLHAPLVCALLAALSSACGRSAEPVVACPAPAADCATLLQQQTTVETAYGAALPVDDEDDGDADARREAGECAAQLVQASLELGCVDRCVELCRLHPCPVLDEAGAVDVDGDCVARCGVVVGQSPAVAIDTAITRAAEEPGLCTCRGCGAPDDALCTGLFDCAP
jgi:hypothetical protein